MLKSSVLPKHVWSWLCFSFLCVYFYLCSLGVPMLTLTCYRSRLLFHLSTLIMWTFMRFWFLLEMVSDIERSDMQCRGSLVTMQQTGRMNAGWKALNTRKLKIRLYVLYLPVCTAEQNPVINFDRWRHKKGLRVLITPKYCKWML